MLTYLYLILSFQYPLVNNWAEYKRRHRLELLHKTSSIHDNDINNEKLSKNFYHNHYVEN